MAFGATAKKQAEAVVDDWSRVLKRLRGDLGESQFRSWFQEIHVERIENGEGVVSLPTRFLRNWVATHYADKLLAAWRAENPAVRRLAIIVEPHAAPPVRPNGAHHGAIAAPADATLAAPIPIAEIGEDRAQMSAPLDPRFTFTNFVVGKPNELAHAAARRVAETLSAPVHSVPFNPLFLYGGVGLGKTHLMHAIAWHVRTHAPQRKVIYLSAEKFMYQFIRALRYRSTMDFKEQFRSVDLLMIDDVQFISGKDSTQEEFFHTFNALVDQNRQIVISADKSPSDLEGLEERMRSRLGWGLVADLHPTTYELRLGILQAKAETSGAQVPGKVLEFLAHKITSNVRELEGALNRIIAHTQLVGRVITLESAHELLHDLLRANERHVTIDEIQEKGRRALQHQDGRDDLGPARPHRRPPAPGGHVSGKAADPALAPRDRPQIRRPRPHHGHARGEEDRGADRRRSRPRGGRRAPPADAA